jgi:hypothetical protein
MTIPTWFYRWLSPLPGFIALSSLPNLEHANAVCVGGQDESGVLGWSLRSAVDSDRGRSELNESRATLRQGQHVGKVLPESDRF